MSVFAALVSPVASLVKGVVNNHHEKKMAKAHMDKILTEAAAKSEEAAGHIALARVESDKDSWKDEIALLTICLPYWVAMISALGGVDALYVQSMFENMAAIPEYWQQTFQYGIWGVLGIVGAKRVFK